MNEILQWLEQLEDTGFCPHKALKSLAHRERLALVDCNQFYVSCERLFRPELRQQAVVILSNNDGCVIALSPEAKALGVGMGQPWFQVRQQLGVRAPLAFSSNYTLYEALSERVMASLRSLDYAVESYSIDEAFVQLPRHVFAEGQARALYERTSGWTGIPVGVGVGSTKALAKVAAWLAKKYYQRPFYVLHDIAELRHVPIGSLWGVGARYAKALRARGVLTAADFMALDPRWIKQKMTLQGLRLYLELHGIVCYPLQDQGKARKNIRHARSLARDESNLQRLQIWLAGFVAQAASKLRHQDSVTPRISVMLLRNRYRHPQTTGPGSLSMRLSYPSNDTLLLQAHARELLARLYQSGVAYKKLGVMLHDLRPAAALSLSWLEQPDIRRARLMDCIDTVQARWGRQSLVFGCQLGAGPYARQNKRSQRYLSDWSELPQVSRSHLGSD